MEFDGERLIPGLSSNDLEAEHRARYEFSSAFVTNRHVLDVACGVGYGTEMLKKAGAKRVLGIDLSAESIAYARKFYKINGISFCVGDACFLNSVKSKSIDVVISFETIEHLRTPEIFLDEISRVLKPNGIFIVSSPDPRCSTRFNLPRRKPSNPFHFKEYRIEELQKMLSYNFKNVETYCQGPVPSIFCNPVLKILIRTISKFLRVIKVFPLDYDFFRGSNIVELIKPGSWAAKYWICVCRL